MTPPRICHTCGAPLSEACYRQLCADEQKAGRDLVALSVVALVAVVLAVWFGVGVVRDIIIFGE